MRPPLNSLRKRIYTSRLSPERCRRRFAGRFWTDVDGRRNVACRGCPKFRPAGPACSVPFGSPLRKCVTAAQEAHLASLEGQSLLEIGHGKHSIPRRLVTAAGGQWTGIDPFSTDEAPAQVGRACRGDVGAIPFPDATFDIVAGIQTLEHWADPLPDGGEPPGYMRGVAEVHRVLKPGGTIYFDAPIHLHGHEMFIVGDVERIAGLFDPDRWRDLVIESWRRDYAPLDRYPTPVPDRRWWAGVTSYPASALSAIAESGSVWLLVLTATKQ